MAERLTGSTAETTPSRSGIRNALAALGLLAASSEALAAEPSKTEKPQETPAVTALAGDTAQKARDCVAEGDAAKKEWLRAEIKEAGVKPKDAKAWLAKMQSDKGFVAELKAKGQEAHTECFLEEAKREQEELGMKIAALDKRIGRAAEVFVQYGFRVAETEAGDAVLKKDDQIVARFVQNPADGKWTMDFSPIDGQISDLEAETETIRAETAAIKAETEASIKRYEEMKAVMEKVWGYIERGEEIPSELADFFKEYAELEKRPIPIPGIKYEIINILTPAKG